MQRSSWGLKEDLVQTTNFINAIKPGVWGQSWNAEEEESMDRFNQMKARNRAMRLLDVPSQKDKMNILIFCLDLF